MTNPLQTTIETAIRRELDRPVARTMPMSALSSHLAAVTLAAIRAAGYEVRRVG